MTNNKRKGNRQLPTTVNPRPTDAQPLSLEYFEQPEREEARSAEVVRRLGRSPFFLPEKNTDGSITNHSMLTVAYVVIAAADREIATTQLVRERIAWWNSPRLQKPVTAAEGNAPGALLAMLSKRAMIPGSSHFLASTSLSATLWLSSLPSPWHIEQSLTGLTPRKPSKCSTARTSRSEKPAGSL
jgi:hypothetical protein